MLVKISLALLFFTSETNLLFSVASVMLCVKDPGAHCAILIKKKKKMSWAACVCVCVYVCEVGNGVVWMGIATHSSILAWKMPWTEEPGRL